MALSQYYSQPYLDQALSSYIRAVPASWTVAERLDLYSNAKTAFDSNAPASEKEQAFEHIYGSLRSGWMVFRNAAGECWSAEQTFRTLIDDCQMCSRKSDLTLANLTTSGRERDLHACFSRMGRIKPTTNYPDVYPWMAVSKFLHFFNPRLFPIFDTEFMWKKVANGAFKHDYRSFCERGGFRPLENTQRFNLQYTLWASEVMNRAGDGCMDTFADWFGEQIGEASNPCGALPDVRFYYAAAFEMIAIGAASIEGG